MLLAPCNIHNRLLFLLRVVLGKMMVGLGWQRLCSSLAFVTNRKCLSILVHRSLKHLRLLFLNHGVIGAMA